MLFLKFSKVLATEASSKVSEMHPERFTIMTVDLFRGARTAAPRGKGKSTAEGREKKSGERSRGTSTSFHRQAARASPRGRASAAAA